MKEKILEHVSVEFRYQDKKPGYNEDSYERKVVTIGIYDTLDEAIKEGNKALDIIANRFDINERFKKVHLFGSPKRLVCSRNYNVHAKIVQLRYEDLNSAAEEVIAAKLRFKKYIKEQEI